MLKYHRNKQFINEKDGVNDSRIFFYILKKLKLWAGVVVNFLDYKTCSKKIIENICIIIIIIISIIII